MKLSSLNIAISVSCVLMTACATAPNIPYIQNEPEYTHDYVAAGKNVYPAAYSEFVNQMQVIDVAPMVDKAGLQISYRTNVSDEMFDKLTKAFTGMDFDRMEKYCNAYSGDLATINLKIDGKSEYFRPVKTANYRDSEQAAGLYDAVAFDRGLCDGEKPKWVFIDTTKTRNFPLPLYSPAMVHVYRNGRFYTEITPGFVPNVDGKNKVTLYGLFLMRGEHEFSVSYPTGDDADRLQRSTLTVKMENASFN